MNKDCYLGFIASARMAVEMQSGHKSRKSYVYLGFLAVLCGFGVIRFTRELFSIR